MRAAIVDDNPLDRLNLRTLLEQVSHVRVVGEAEDLAGGKALLAREKPEAVFLDVRLGQANGFALLEDLAERPLVVFTTLHRQYAAQAFEVEAADYLLKPITQERLARTLHRLAVSLDRQGVSPPCEPGDLLVFRQGDERRVIAVERISAVCGDGDYTRVLTSEGPEYLDDRRMRDWQAMLPPKLFRALDRSTIVNLAQVSSYRQNGEGGALTLHNISQPLEIGRSAFRRLEEFMHRK